MESGTEATRLFINDGSSFTLILHIKSQTPIVADINRVMTLAV
jgi:hypothetical protein